MRGVVAEGEADAAPRGEMAPEADDAERGEVAGGGGSEAGEEGDSCMAGREGGRGREDSGGWQSERSEGHGR